MVIMSMACISMPMNCATGDENENRPPGEEAVDGKDRPPRSQERSGAAKMTGGVPMGPLPIIFPFLNSSGIEEWVEIVVGEC